jgi:hypothetical protein
MKTLWQDETRREVVERIGQLTPERKPEWGRMSSHQMVGHLIRSVQMATGELHVKSKSTPLGWPGVRQLVVYYLPFPKNVPTAPELLVATTPNAFSADLSDLRETINRMVARGQDARWPEHPAFGPLTGDAWGVLVYRHMDHHLRQFGV